MDIGRASLPNGSPISMTLGSLGKSWFYSNIKILSGKLMLMFMLIYKKKNLLIPAWYRSLY